MAEAHGRPGGTPAGGGAAGLTPRIVIPDVIAGRTIYRDGEYAAYGVAIELDGVAHHGAARARASDSIRDLETLATRDEVTVRITHQQVFRDACRTGRLVARILQRRGWIGRPDRCPRCP